MEELVPLAPFIMVVLIVVTVYFFSSRNRREVLETVREALRNGRRWTQRPSRRWACLRKNQAMMI